MVKKREPVIRIAYLDWVYRQPLRMPRTAILAYLVRRSNKDARCWPEQRTIADDVGCTTRTVVRSLRVLKLCGLVTIIRQEKRGHGQCGVKNTYQMNYAADVSREAVMQVEKVAKMLDQSDTESLRWPPTKVTLRHDQSDCSSTEERH